MAERAWRGTSHGGGLGTALVALAARLGGRDMCYFFVLPPALWFWLRDRAARRAIFDYWRRLHPDQGAWRAWLRVPLHFWIFARGLADRMLIAVAPGSVRQKQQGLENISGIQRGRGIILLSAHIGIFELSARWLATQLPADAPRLNLVMLDAEDPRVQAHIDRTMGARPYSVIDLRDPLTASLGIAAALGRGEICCMLGDRTAGSITGTRQVNFLARQARLPVGPFIAASASRALLVPCFCHRVGWSTWLCEADPAWEIDLGPRAGREERLQAVMQRWADRLESLVRRSPYNWNNYFDFWA